jgi:hypothetical protein
MMPSPASMASRARSGQVTRFSAPAGQRRMTGNEIAVIVAVLRDLVT